MRAALGMAVVLILVTGAATIAAPARKATVSFADDIQPILDGRCVSCHQPGGEGLEKSGLDLRTYRGVMAGTRFGPVVVPGDAATSTVMTLLDGRAAPALLMPHGKAKRLSSCDRDAIRAWIGEGARNN